MAVKIRGGFNISRPLFFNPLFDSNESQREVQNIAFTLFKPPLQRNWKGGGLIILIHI